MVIQVKSKIEAININRALKEINKKNILNIVEIIQSSMKDIDIIFFIGSGFLGYVGGLEKCTWKDFALAKYPVFSNLDFFEYINIDLDYEENIKIINEKLETPNFKNFGFKDFVDSIHKIFLHVNGNNIQPYGNSNILFLTTNHCKTIEKYFNINNTFCLNDILDKKQIITNYNCFYLHSYSKERITNTHSNWIYQIDHYNKFLNSNMSIKIIQYFNYIFKNKKIIFCFGSSLNEIQIISAISQLNTNLKPYIVVFKKFVFKKDTYNLKNEIEKFNLAMNDGIDKRIIYLYVENYNEYQMIFSELVKEIENMVSKLDITKRELYYTGKNIHQTFEDENNNYLSIIGNYKLKNEKLSCLLKNKKFKILNKIMINFQNDFDTLLWIHNNKIKIYALKDFNFFSIIDGITNNLRNPNIDKEILLDLIIKFFKKEKVAEIQFSNNEYQIILFMQEISKHCHKNIIAKLCINTTLDMIWNLYNRNFFFEEEYLEILNNIISHPDIDSTKKFFKDKLVSLNQTKSVDKILWIFNIINFEILKINDILDILNFSVEQLLDYIYNENTFNILSNYFSKNVSDFETWIELFRNKNNYMQKLFCIMKKNINLETSFSQYFDPNIKMESFSNNIRININLEDSKMEIDLFNKPYDMHKILHRIFSLDVYDEVDLLLYFFKKLKFDDDNDWEEITNFFKIIDENNIYREKIKHSYLFFPAIFNKAFEYLLISFMVNKISLSEFKKMLNILTDYSFCENEHILSLYNIKFDDINILIDILIECYNDKHSFIIKSILNVFNFDFIDIFSLHIKYTDQSFSLFDILQELYNKDYLEKIIDYILPNHSLNHIFQIFNGNTCKELLIFKYIYKNYDNMFLSEILQIDKLNILINKNLKNFYLLKYKENDNYVNRIYFIINVYNDILRLSLRKLGSGEFAYYIFNDENLDFLKKINQECQFLFQILYFIREGIIIEKKDIEFIGKNIDFTLNIIYKSSNYFYEINVKLIDKLINLLYNNINNKINDELFYKISNTLETIHIVQKNKFKIKEMRILLYISIFIFKRIEHNLFIKNTYLYKILKNKNNLKIDINSVNSIMKDIWDSKN